jgi:hypothetical protein
MTVTRGSDERSDERIIEGKAIGWKGHYSFVSNALECATEAARGEGGSLL